MHILIIHQAFAALDEAGGTRHHELARNLAARGHQVTIIASPVSYLTGQANSGDHQNINRNEIEPGVTIIRAYTYSALHRSFVHRVFSFLSFMVTSFFKGIGTQKGRPGVGYFPAHFSRLHCLAGGAPERSPISI